MCGIAETSVLIFRFIFCVPSLPGPHLFHSIPRAHGISRTPTPPHMCGTHAHIVHTLSCMLANMHWHMGMCVFSCAHAQHVCAHNHIHVCVHRHARAHTCPHLTLFATSASLRLACPVPLLYPVSPYRVFKATALGSRPLNLRSQAAL